LPVTKKREEKSRKKKGGGGADKRSTAIWNGKCSREDSQVVQIQQKHERTYLQKKEIRVVGADQRVAKEAKRFKKKGHRNVKKKEGKSAERTAVVEKPGGGRRKSERGA